MNDRERELWTDNDEGIYNWWKSTGKSKRSFIRDEREELDRIIKNVLDGNKPAHYLAYPQRREP